LEPVPFLSTALAGLVLVRRHPIAAMIWWAAASLALWAGVGLVAIFVILIPEPAPRVDSFRTWLLIATIFAPFLASLPMIAAAVVRTTLTPTDAGLGYLRLGMAEVRIAATMVILLGGYVLVGGVLPTGAATFAAVLGFPIPTGPAVAVGMVCGVLVVGRFFGAPAYAVETRSLGLASGWRLTRGRLPRAYLIQVGALAVAVTFAGATLYAFAKLIEVVESLMQRVQVGMQFALMLPSLSVLTLAVTMAVIGLVAPAGEFYRRTATSRIEDVF
jgi:hypothetical protein